MISKFISVIMPVYNCELFLHDSIGSILKQSYRNYEFIIINDGSEDSSLEIIKSYSSRDNRIKVINQRNKGLIESLNLGVSISKGEYIARMDADDISLVNRFEMQLTHMINNNIDVCGCIIMLLMLIIIIKMLLLYLQRVMIFHFDFLVLFHLLMEVL